MSSSQFGILSNRQRAQVQKKNMEAYTQRSKQGSTEWDFLNLAILELSIGHGEAALNLISKLSEEKFSCLPPTIRHLFRAMSNPEDAFEAIRSDQGLQSLICLCHEQLSTNTSCNPLLHLELIVKAIEADRRGDQDAAERLYCLLLCDPRVPLESRMYFVRALESSPVRQASFARFIPIPETSNPLVIIFRHPDYALSKWSKADFREAFDPYHAVVAHFVSARVALRRIREDKALASELILFMQQRSETKSSEEHEENESSVEQEEESSGCVVTRESLLTLQDISSYSGHIDLLTDHLLEDVPLDLLPIKPPFAVVCFRRETDLQYFKHCIETRERQVSTSSYNYVNLDKHIYSSVEHSKRQVDLFPPSCSFLRPIDLYLLPRQWRQSHFLNLTQALPKIQSSVNWI